LLGIAFEPPEGLHVVIGQHDFRRLIPLEKFLDVHGLFLLVGFNVKFVEKCPE
jgi:hypothetical protein